MKNLITDWHWPIGLGALMIIMLTMLSTDPVLGVTPVHLQQAEADPLMDVMQVATGYVHTCSLSTTGEVHCWGYDAIGLENRTFLSTVTPWPVSGLPNNIAAVATGTWFTCILTTEGRVQCWGSNGSGQLGNGTTDYSTSPIDVTGFETDVTALALGQFHACAILNTGNVNCWGHNGDGQLGDGTSIDRTTPVAIRNVETPMTALALGYTHTCAVTQAGAVKCWGDNRAGQLGNGTRESTLEAINVIGLNDVITDLAAGEQHTCALAATGKVSCWGSNGAGQLGDGTTESRLTPVEVVGLESVVALTAGRYHTCALTTDGKVRCWGANNAGQLGDGSLTDRLRPVDVAAVTDQLVGLDAHDSHTCAVADSGNVLCWGENKGGQLGLGRGPYHNQPVAVHGVTDTPLSISSGLNHTCAHTPNNLVNCWGNNQRGQLGNGTNIHQTEPVTVTGLTAQLVVTGDSHSCAITQNDAVQCWGNNGYGELGSGTLTPSNVPVDVIGLGDTVTALTAGGKHTCAILGNGSAKCWGQNEQGQLGDNSNEIRLLPTDVLGLSEGIQTITAGYLHTCALTERGSVKCWGSNAYGQLGDGTTINRALPVDVIDSEETVIAITAGDAHTCAITEQGAVKCWGDNGSGQLGDGTNVSSTSPVDVIDLQTTVTAIAAGWLHTCAIDETQSVFCWGYNEQGQLGNDLVFATSLPYKVTALTAPATAITAGSKHTCVAISVAAATQTGAARDGIQCWGWNYYGQLGNGELGYSVMPQRVVAPLRSYTLYLPVINHSPP